MPEPEDIMESVGTGTATQFDSQKTQAMAMVPMAVDEQEQGKPKELKK